MLFLGKIVKDLSKKVLSEQEQGCSEEGSGINSPAGASGLRAEQVQRPPVPALKPVRTKEADSRWMVRQVEGQG